jgi:hypothetical protein
MAVHFGPAAACNGITTEGFLKLSLVRMASPLIKYRLMCLAFIKLSFVGDTFHHIAWLEGRPATHRWCGQHTVRLPQ